MGDTDRIQRRSILSTWLPLGAVLTALGVAGAAGVIWATDRSELHAGTKTNNNQDIAISAHEGEINRLKAEAAVRDARATYQQAQLDQMQRTLERIADRVGATPRAPTR